MLFSIARKSATSSWSGCPLREEKSFSQRAFLILRIFANYKIKPKLLSNLVQADIIEPVSGHGKQYRIIYQTELLWKIGGITVRFDPA